MDRNTKAKEAGRESHKEIFVVYSGGPRKPKTNFVFLSLQGNGLCVPLCSFRAVPDRTMGHSAASRYSPHPLAKKRLRRTFQLTESVSYANMNATRDESLFRPCGKFPFDKSSISRFSIP